MGLSRFEPPPDADLVRDALRGSREAMAELLRMEPDVAPVSADPAEAAETAEATALALVLESVETPRPFL